MADETKDTIEAKPKAKRASAKDKGAEVPWPNTLWKLKPGARLVMKGTNAVVATVDSLGRPLTVATRDDKGKTVNVPFKVEDFVRLK